ncbi:conserved hypothetical protein [Ricinus communis]|uniref:Retrotransposon Copia-like N-terminal domain-containing protein n=1 Tax=Ricinus communis TaxID=3988 RepID=B9RWV6_RICCO|nr:conserved hypothetical protein [Ricinus communis]
MANDQKNLLVTEVIPMMSKITEYKLTGSNYLDWRKIVQIYLHSISKDNHPIEDPPVDKTCQEQ